MLYVTSGVILLLVLVFLIPASRRFIIYKTPLGKVFASKQDAAAVPPPANAATGDAVSKGFPEPDINRIKADLIGQQIPGWTFDKTEEFREASISSIARTDLRIDFRLDLKLQAVAGDDKSVYNAQMFTTYLAGDEDWYLDKLMLIFISFEAEITPGKWNNIYSIPGCTMQPDPQVKLEWTSKAWDYAVFTGPEYESVTLPAADIYQVRNKGKKTVRVRLTFRPAE